MLILIASITETTLMIGECIMTRIIEYLRPYIGGKNFQSQLDQFKASGATKIYQEQTVGIERRGIDQSSKGL